MHAQRPEGPALSGQRPPLPARAMSAQVKLAGPAYPAYPVRRADRGPAPITRLIHLPPPAGPLPDPGPRSYTPLSAHPVNLLSRLGRSCGHRAPTARPRAGLRRRPPSSRLGDTAFRRPTRPGPGPGIATRVPSACPPQLIQSGRSPARYMPGPRCAARDQRQRETLPSAPCRPD